MRFFTKHFTKVLMLASLIAVAFLFVTGSITAMATTFLAVPFVFGMAKVTGPLMSMDARGKIGNAMVFMGWKGVKTVRMWLKPKNPQTEDQVTQRGYFTSAVNKHHLLLGTDKIAWNARASGQALSGFNLFVKKVVDCLYAALAWALLSEVTSDPGSTTTCDIDGMSDNGERVKIKYGLSSGVYPYEKEESGTRAIPGAFTASLTGLTANTLYFYMVENITQTSVRGETGEYTFTTPAT
jgi:hypothetical protein